MRTEPALVHPLVLLGLLAACGSDPEAPAQPAAGDPVADPAAAGHLEPVPPVGPTVSESVKTEPSTTAAAAEPTAAAPASDTPTAVDADASPLRLVAVRDGIIDLLPYHDAPLLALEGEPIPWVAGRFAPEPKGWLGLPPSLDPMEMVSFTSAVGGGAQDLRPPWVTTERHYERTGSVYEVHERRGDRWTKLDLRKKPLAASYSAYVEREGAVLALRTWQIDPAEEPYEEPEDEAASARLEAKYEAQRRTLERAKPSWIQLAGDPIAVPQIPPKTLLFSAVSTPDGTIHAVTHPRGDEEQRRLLMWPPGATKAVSVPVPELDHAWEVTLSVSGDHVLAHGSLEIDEAPDESFLAVGRGKTWERIPTKLPDREEDGAMNIMGAARTPEGELWIALGARDMESTDAQPVWRKPVGGSWEPVALPMPKAELFGPSKGWMYESPYGRQDWVEFEREPIVATDLRALGLVWASGAVWVSIRIDTSAGMPRSMVLTTRPITTEPVVLEPSWRNHLARGNESFRGAEPVGDRCEMISLVVGPASLVTDEPELVRTLAALEVPDSNVGATYTGELDGAKVLVVHAVVSSWNEADMIRKEIEKATGRTVTLDCRIPMLETMVSP